MIIDWLIQSAWRAVVTPFALVAMAAWLLGAPPHIAILIGSALVATFWASIDYWLKS